MSQPYTARIAHFGLKAIALTGLLVTGSCMNQPQTATPPPQPPASEIDRFHIVVAAEGDRGSVVFLVDSKTGETWIYRPPQGTVINGFWSDIPRLTYAPDYWQKIFSQAGQTSATSGVGNIQSPSR